MELKQKGVKELKHSSKVTLKSKGDSFAIKPTPGTQELLINLNWNQNPQEQKKGLLSKIFKAKKQAIDLDLGCLFEMQNGIKGALQPLGKSFGSFNHPPYILHLGDDRTGEWSEGENMKINLAYINQLQRILIFTYIYEGIPKWSSTDAVVTIKVPDQPVLEVHMGIQENTKNFCAVAMLDFIGSNINITRLISFHKGHPDCDKTYGWGLRWVAGSKD